MLLLILLYAVNFYGLTERRHTRARAHMHKHLCARFHVLVLILAIPIRNSIPFHHEKNEINADCTEPLAKNSAHVQLTPNPSPASARFLWRHNKWIRLFLHYPSSFSCITKIIAFKHIKCDTHTDG